jgi:CubicO group peptidase (beta-lactamase class C family)
MRLVGSLFALASTACGGAEPTSIQAPPRRPPGVASASAPSGQQFAAREPELAFRDPGRAKKLRLAFPKIDEIASEELAKQGIPSIALGVVIDGELAYANGYTRRTDRNVGRRADRRHGGRALFRRRARRRRLVAHHFLRLPRRPPRRRARRLPVAI